MSEQQPQQTSNPSDPLASLHRMSTTAGAASQEYVAINLAAVAALVLGLASVLVLFANVLLLVPLAALLFGIVAVRQVSRSNGTQTGKPLAVAGIALAVALLGFVGVREVQARMAVSEQRKLIEVTVGKLEKAVKAEDYNAIWDLFSPQFKQVKQIGKEQFVQRWKAVSDSPVYGKVTSVRLNDRLILEDAGKDKLGLSVLVVSLSKVEQPAMREVHFRKTGGEWLIEDVPQMFPPEEAGQSAAPPTVPQF